MAAVDVPAALVRREGLEAARLVGGHPHGAEERLNWNLDARGDSRRRAIPEVEDLEVRIGEVVRQQAEPGDDRRPTPRTGFELEDLDLERVARRRSLDEDRAAEVVDRLEVPHDLVDGGGLEDLTVARHRELEMDDVARADRERGLATPIPVVVDPARVESVLAAHPGRV